MGRIVAAGVSLFVFTFAAASVDAQTGSVGLAAHVRDEPIARTNDRLIGVGWDRASFTPREMKPLRPHLVRIDASFEHLYRRGPSLDRRAFAALRDEIADARSIGAAPVVILSYMPAWLALQRPSSDATKVPPADVETWRRLVAEVVDRLSAIGVQWFEVWNEPDFPVFFQGSASEFFERIYLPSAQAVQDVARRTKRPLRFGGCACVTANPVWIVEMMRFAREHELPLDFISWHSYGNAPFLGPDGAEPLGPPEFRPLLLPLRQRNPLTSPAFYGDQVRAVRSWRDAIYGEASSRPELWLDEWNLSPGGFDRRHDTAEGAAFQAAVLIELQRAGVDRAAIFRSVDPAYGNDVVPARPELYGGWGLVGRYGKRKPAWMVHRFWGELGDDVLAVGADVDARTGVSAILARRDARTFTVLASNFVAAQGRDRSVVVELAGARGTWTVVERRVDGSVRARRVTSSGKLVVSVELAAQSVVFVELRGPRRLGVR